MTTKPWQPWIPLLLAAQNNHWAAVEMNGEQQHDAGIWLSSQANASQKAWQARWSKDEHSACFMVGCVWCCVLDTERNSHFKDCELDSGYGAYVCYCSVSKAGCMIGLKHNKIWATLVSVFLRSFVFLLRGTTMRWVYEKLSGFTTTILRHLSVKMFTIILLCPCVHLVLNILT